MFSVDNSYGIIQETDVNISGAIYSQPVEVGNDAWIAAGAQISRGVKIGDGTVIGAGLLLPTMLGHMKYGQVCPQNRSGKDFQTIL